ARYIRRGLDFLHLFVSRTHRRFEGGRQRRVWSRRLRISHAADSSRAARMTTRGTRLSFAAFVARLCWLDGSPLSRHIEPYRARIFAQALDTFEPDGRPRYNFVVAGRAKKCWKTADLALAALF